MARRRDFEELFYHDINGNVCPRIDVIIDGVKYSKDIALPTLSFNNFNIIVGETYICDELKTGTVINGILNM